MAFQAGELRQEKETFTRNTGNSLIMMEGIHSGGLIFRLDADRLDVCSDWLPAVAQALPLFAVVSTKN